MSEQEKLEALAEILEKDIGLLTPTARLDDLGWDSMSMLGVIAFARTHGKTIAGPQLRSLQTVGDLLCVL